MKIFFRTVSLLDLDWIFSNPTRLICLVVLFQMRASATPEISAPASYPLPIEELVTEAINNNLELRSYEAELGVARGERRQAGMWKNPEFEGNYAYRRVSDAQELLTGEGVSRGLAIVQTFEFPGKGSLRKAIANQNIRLAELGVQQFRQALAGQVRSLGIQWIVVRANAEATAELSERSQALLQLLEARPIAGPTKLLEFRAIQGSLTDLHFTARELKQKQEEIRIQLNSLLGRPDKEEIRLDQELGTPAFPVGDILNMLRSGEENNLQLRIRQLELERAAKAAGVEVELIPGEGAFYGPKLEFHLRDAIGRTWQCGTLQLDFVLPERLDAEYIAEDGSKQRPVMLHRAILGTFERFLGILIENYGGAFPIWLAPVQVVVATITSDSDEYACAVAARLELAGLRVETDLRNEKINYKVREHSLIKTPVIAVVGRKEAETGQVALRHFGSEGQTLLDLDAAVAALVAQATPPDLVRP